MDWWVWFFGFWLIWLFVLVAFLTGIGGY